MEHEVLYNSYAPDKERSNFYYQYRAAETKNTFIDIRPYNHVRTVELISERIIHVVDADYKDHYFPMEVLLFFYIGKGEKTDGR